MSFSETEVAQFRRDGFIVGGEVLTTDELSALSERIDAIAAGEVEFAGRIVNEKEVPDDTQQRERVFQIFDAHAHDAVVESVCSSDRIVDKVESLIGSSIKLFSDQTLMKPAFHGSIVTWHQDFPYWPFDRPELVSCWLAIDAATSENGCMRLIPGSHKHGVLPTQETNNRLRDQEGADNTPHVAAELPAGHCLFHHCLTLHSSPPNSSPESRRAISITFMPGELKWTGQDQHAYRRDFLRLRG